MPSYVEEPCSIQHGEIMAKLNKMDRTIWSLEAGRKRVRVVQLCSLVLRASLR